MFEGGRENLQTPCLGMMVVSGEGQRGSWHPPLEGTVMDLSVPLSSPPLVDGEVISPLSPLSARTLFSTDRRCHQTPPLMEGALSRVVEANSPLVEEPRSVDYCWSDATTASAVLSLLHKEPMGSASSTPGHGYIRNAPPITCSVCFETLEPNMYPQTSIAAECDHTSILGTHICTICLSRSLDVQFSNLQTSALTCPLCHTQLSDEEIERWASRPTFQAYDVSRTWQILDEDADFVRCINPHCGYGQLHAGGPADPVVICAICGVQTCYTHRTIPWHEGFSCAEYEMWNQSNMVPESLIPSPPTVLRIGGPRREQFAPEDFLSRRTIQKTTRTCPNCLVATEKAGGCKYMRCGVCWQEWCWDCGIFWERGHLSVDCSMGLNDRE
ncbi:hypothetical protein BJY00DRAFT_259294 [Aspergillus carlsbadensis]|nr:hypothetical protein BJY00DRAFT_259294 [Aspergillus carlsbadensis]